MSGETETWKFYEKLVVSKLEELWLLQRTHADTLRRIEIEVVSRPSAEAFRKLEIELVQMKTRAGLLGFVAGAIPLVATTLYQIFVK